MLIKEGLGFRSTARILQVSLTAVLNWFKKQSINDQTNCRPANADDKTIASKLKDKAAAIVVYCGGHKCNAAMTLAERMARLGYTNVSHFAGGIPAWKEKGLPVTAEKAK